MASIVRMPEIAANAESATLISWEVHEGTVVREGDTLALIETDKATVDLVAEHDGTLVNILAEAGQQVEVGTPVAWLLAEGESNEHAEPCLSAELSQSDETTPPSHHAHVSAPDSATSSDQPRGHGEDRVFASPLARRLASEHGVNLRDIQGSGPNGRIVKRDVLGAPAASETHDVLAASDAISRIPHSNMRKTIARRLSESKATIPHFYLDAECRVGALLTLRDQINGSIDGKISFNDLIIKAVACALRDSPDMNVIWTDDALLRYRDVEISVAVATDNGLYTPVLRDVGQMSLTEISHDMGALAQRARHGQLSPSEYQGGTFSISNLGMFGVSGFSAIINPPQSAILAVGAIRRMPVVVDDQVRIEAVLKCTLSVDHRAIDGALAAQWLSRYTRYIEQPWAMLV